ncbi:MAG: ROK family protein [Anaerolineae bacterium]|nr:ROK family protein [Anaerolineae bacterium]
MMQRDNTFAVGVDIGGTNSQAAVISRDQGAIVSRVGQPTDAAKGPEAGLQAIGDLIAQAIAQADLDPADIAGIGVGCTGPLDVDKGLIMEPWTMPGWVDVPIVDHLVARFDRPVYLDNDCNVAALGEHWIGAGQGHKDMLYLTVSTGIGAGIIIDNRLRQGFGYNMGEVGLMSIDMDGPACFEGSSGCWEYLAAGPAIAQVARQQADQAFLAAANGDPDQITAAIVARLAGEGHPIARSIMEQEAYYLGVGLANLLVILAPEIVVMGGGVMKSWDVLAPAMIRIVRERTRLISSAQVIPIVRAQLELSAGFIGAARMVFQTER